MQLDKMPIPFCCEAPSSLPAAGGVSKQLQHTHTHTPEQKTRLNQHTKTCTHTVPHTPQNRKTSTTSIDFLPRQVDKAGPMRRIDPRRGPRGDQWRRAGLVRDVRGRGGAKRGVFWGVGLWSDEQGVAVIGFRRGGFRWSPF